MTEDEVLHEVLKKYPQMQKILFKNDMCYFNNILKTGYVSEDLQKYMRATNNIHMFIDMIKYNIPIIRSVQKKIVYPVPFIKVTYKIDNIWYLFYRSMIFTKKIETDFNFYPKIYNFEMPHPMSQ